MGAWGAKPFDNDAALDLFEEIETGGVADLRALLVEVADTDHQEYLDVDDGSGAIAAAEIVAAAFGKSRARLSDRLAAWLETNRRTLTAGDVSVAKRAVARVLGEQSELRELWEDGGGPRNPWQASVEALAARLEELAATAS